MKLKDIEIKIMPDEAYGDHLDKLFDDTRDGKITGKQKIKSCPEFLPRTYDRPPYNRLPIKCQQEIKKISIKGDFSIRMGGALF